MQIVPIFRSKTKMSEKKAKPTQNCRKMFANAICRADIEMKKGVWADEHFTQLNERIEMVKETFTKFTEQHQEVVKNCDKKVFVQQDEYYARIEQIYQHIVLCLRKLVRTAEAKDALSQMTSEDEQERAGSKPTEDTRMEFCDSSSEEAKTRQSEVTMVPQRDLHRFRMPLNTSRARRDDLREKLKRNNEQLDRVNRSINAQRNYSRTIEVSRGAPKRLSCFNCGKFHPMSKCVKFVQLPIQARAERVYELRLCRNCLMPKGDRHRCPPNHKHCRLCGPGTFHNSLLCGRSR